MREVLRAAALLGVDFAVPDLAIVLDRGVADLVPAIDEARAAGVLTESGTGLGFRHPLIRTALYEEMPVPVRAAWHRDAGACARGGRCPGRPGRPAVAPRTEPGQRPTDPMDEWMLSWLARTADLLVGQAPQVAAELLRLAVAGSAAGSAHHDFLVSRLADTLYRVGDAAEAEQVASRALAIRRARSPRRPALDAGAVPDAGRPVRPALDAGAVPPQAGESASPLPRWTVPWSLRGSRPGTARGCWCLPHARTATGAMSRRPVARRAALEAAEEAGDNWAMGWALHVLTIVTGMQGQMTDRCRCSTGR